MAVEAVDHLVYACPVLADVIEEIAAATGVRAAPGGRHPGLGTRNALLGLGGRSYLELIGPDPAEDRPAAPRPFGLDDLATPALRAWAAAASDLEAAVRAARSAGHDPGEPVVGERRTPDGGEVRWRMTPPGSSDAVAVAPFLISWNGSPHPALSAPGGLTLEQFVISTPDPSGLARLLGSLGLAVEVEDAAMPGLLAVLRGPGGAPLVLRS
jgi:hypothetical protein